MFDIGFSEILLISVLALIVLGPERLPGVVRRVGRWVGRARAMARQFQEQLEEEMDLEETRKRPSPLAPDPPVHTELPPGPAAAEEPRDAPDPVPDPVRTQGVPDTHEPRA